MAEIKPTNEQEKTIFKMLHIQGIEPVTPEMLVAMKHAMRYGELVTAKKCIKIAACESHLDNMPIYKQGRLDVVIDIRNFFGIPDI